MLITRPGAAAQDTAARVAALGFVPILAPLLAIRPLAVRLPAGDRLQAVLLTSANALPALGAAFHGVRLLAVGDATAARARAAGFTDVASAGADAAALARLVARHCTPKGGALLLPTARREGMALARRLRDAGFAVQRRAVYAAEPQGKFPDAANAALAQGTVAAVLFFSPSTARGFVRLARPALLEGCLCAVDALALSPAVAVPLARLPWRRIRVAARPDQEALLTLLADPKNE